MFVNKLIKTLERHHLPFAFHSRPQFSFRRTTITIIQPFEMLNLSAGGGATNGLQQYYQQQAALPVATAALNSVGVGAGAQYSQAQQQMALAAFQQAAVAGASTSASATPQLLPMQLMQPAAAALFSPVSLQSLQGYQTLPAFSQMGAATLSSAAQSQQQLLSQLSLMQQLAYPSGLPPLQLSLPLPFHLPHFSQSAAGLPTLPFVAGPAFVPDLTPPPAAPHVLKVASILAFSRSGFRCCFLCVSVCLDSSRRTQTHFQSALLVLYMFTFT